MTIHQIKVLAGLRVAYVLEEAQGVLPSMAVLASAGDLTGGDLRVPDRVMLPWPAVIVMTLRSSTRVSSKSRRKRRSVLVAGVA